MRQGNLRSAAALVDAHLIRAPDNADAWYLRGVIANRHRDLGAAIGAFRQAIAIRPSDALAWLGLGNALARADRLDEATDAYGRVLQQEPDWADAHFNLGVVRRRQGDRLAAARSLHAAWLRSPAFSEAGKLCVATIAELVRTSGGNSIAPPVGPAAHESFTIVLCSIDDEKCGRAVALYRRLFAGIRHEIVAVRDASSLAEAYNEAIARSAAHIVVLSHDDVDVLAPDFAARISRHLQAFDVVGVVGSVRMDGPAIGWSGHPYLRGWITHRASDDQVWHVDGLDARLTAAGIVVLDGVLLAARRSTFAEVPFDATTFDGFHLYDIDWSYRASRAGFRLGVAGDLLVVHASRGQFGTTWQRYAERFCAKHGVGRSPPRPSSFIGARFDTPDEVRTFFAILARLNGLSNAVPTSPN